MDEAETLRALEEWWARSGVVIDAHVDTKRRHLELSRIVVPPTRRGEGLGTKAMENLMGYADEFGLLFILTPSTDFGGSSVARLQRFYKRFGFVMNKGRNKIWEIRASMYREPVVT